MATETLVKLPHEDRKSIAFKCMCIGQRNILAKRYANLIAKGLSYKTGQITQASIPALFDSNCRRMLQLPNHI